MIARNRRGFELAFREYLNDVNAPYPEHYDYGITYAEATRIRSKVRAAILRLLASSSMRQDRKAAASGGYPF